MGIYSKTEGAFLINNIALIKKNTHILSLNAMLSNISSDFNTDKKSTNSAFLQLDDTDHFILVPNNLVADNRRTYVHLGTNNIYDISVNNDGLITASYKLITDDDKITFFALQCEQTYC